MNNKDKLVNILENEFSLGKEELMQNHGESINHMIRCSKISELFSDYLNFSEIEKDRLVLCALLHDIGKIAIDKNIMYKKNITEDDFKVIKSHVDYNYESHDKAISDSIHCHHCKPTGNGYGGMQGNVLYEDIHLYAKIVSLLDVFDVLTHKRVYKSNVMDIENVVLELKKYAGIQFDEELTEKFIDFLIEREILIKTII